MEGGRHLHLNLVYTDNSVRPVCFMRQLQSDSLYCVGFNRVLLQDMRVSKYPLPHYTVPPAEQHNPIQTLVARVRTLAKKDVYVLYSAVQKDITTDRIIRSTQSSSLETVSVYYRVVTTFTTTAITTNTTSILTTTKITNIIINSDMQDYN